ncbi:MAG: phenylacetate--CoA ligase family protein [Kiritimatiellae bacterium]|nr:phenylacetate--CoA ligase family protein [Kiritimatiellia bacterium]MBQ8126675.1 phenylacetate--CoA ligase family protein [Kiritimatiellia bacterium]
MNLVSVSRYGVDMKIKSILIGALRYGQTRTFIRQVADVRTQVEMFNEIWQDAIANVPFYSEWKATHDLPNAIGDIAELVNWPILNKQDLILNRDKLIRKDIKRFHESVTGGATGEPLHFRTMAGESDTVAMNKWIGWARMGIYPDSRCFLLWGHRHFYGQGFLSNLKFAWRQVKDRLTNNLRMDATNLSPDALAADMRRLVKFKPECVIAYSASLLALVRACGEYADVCRNLGVRAVICSAGPLTKSEREEISKFFNAPVGMEYGSMEAGVMAYQTPVTGGRYAVFDNTHILHSEADGFEDRKQILVTTISRRYLPLIRYRIGDYMIDECVHEDGSVRAFSEVTGRTGDMVDLGEGVRFHGYSMMVCAEENPKIIAYQLRVKKKDGLVTFVAQTTAPLTEAERTQIQRHAADVASISPNQIRVEDAKELVKAPSGKIRLVVKEP